VESALASQWVGNCACRGATCRNLARTPLQRIKGRNVHFVYRRAGGLIKPITRANVRMRAAANEGKVT